MSGSLSLHYFACYVNGMFVFLLKVNKRSQIASLFLTSQIPSLLVKAGEHILILYLNPNTAKELHTQNSNGNTHALYINKAPFEFLIVLGKSKLTNCSNSCASKHNQNSWVGLAAYLHTGSVACCYVAPLSSLYCTVH